MADLPDWFTQVQSATLRATSFAGGNDADKSASPVAEDVWLALDTGILYVCFTSGAWTNIGNLYLLLAGGTMTGAIAMGDNKITGLAAPTADADAARKVDVDTVEALLDDVSGAAPSRALDTIYQNTSGKTIICYVTVRCRTNATLGSSTATAQRGAASPPTTTIASVRHEVNAADTEQQEMGVRGTLTFIVPDNDYYRVATATGGGGYAPTLISWYEDTLF